MVRLIDDGWDLGCSCSLPNRDQHFVLTKLLIRHDLKEWMCLLGNYPSFENEFVFRIFHQSTIVSDVYVFLQSKPIIIIIIMIRDIPVNREKNHLVQICFVSYSESDEQGFVLILSRKWEIA